MGIFFDFKSERKPGGEWRRGEKVIGFWEEGLEQEIGQNELVRVVHFVLLCCIMIYNCLVNELWFID